MPKIKKCCVQGCTDETSTRHRFPMRDLDLFDNWLQIIQPRNWQQLTRHRIYEGSAKVGADGNDHNEDQGFIVLDDVPNKLAENTQILTLQSTQKNSINFKRCYSTITEKMSKFKVLVANSSVPQIAHDLLKAECDVRVCEAEREPILQNIRGVDALFWSSHHKLDKEMLDKAGPQLKVIGTMSAGYDNIDVEEIRKRGIKFGNTPGVLNDAVADMTVLLALMTSRRYLEGRESIEKSTWSEKNGPQWLLGRDLSGSTVGIVGLGNIGQTILSRLKCFKVEKFLYTGHKEKPEGKCLSAHFVPMDTLLQESDFVIASVPLTKSTEGMFNAEAFSKMKKTAIFINVSRGGIVNQPDLVGALKKNQIYAAGIDVMTPEPLPPDHELLKLKNCVVTPHMGSATINTRNSMAELAAKNILKALKGEPMIAPVV
ncbi:glyoxylate reductase/hydroxypyruvate reductase-like isoform X2 [Harmonia axyridis]|uniref:glyoxylate reductase/hydroxypyruvate reductase-like isoform X2 n=1 Tax=Harmonia axyridis TaxID=115357 RepID=UPI001E276923|nr:glyoxylate reductase/hydroxypyruvate reductase-like isoform X2 [Harmonia axyridis]